MYINNFLHGFFVFLIIILACSCTNTRVIVEGTKKVLKSDDKNNNTTNIKIENNQELLTSGHYKIGNPYKVAGIEYVPKLLSNYEKSGIASWYGPKFHNKLTANGELFDQNSISAAHKTLPLPSIVKVTNLDNKRFIYVRVNDRGPFVNNRIIDLSKKAAITLGFYEKGITNVKVKLIDTGPHLLKNKFLNHPYLSDYTKKIEKNNIENKKNNNISIVLQVGAFNNKKNANKLLNFLKRKISDNLFLKHNKDDGNHLYKVFVGPFNKEETAKNIANELLELGYNSIYMEE